MDAVSFLALLALGWGKDHRSWIMFLLIFKESLMLLCLLCNHTLTLLSYVVLLSSMGPTLLLGLCLSRQSYQGRMIRYYLFYACLGKTFLLSLDYQVSIHMSLSKPSIAFLMLIFSSSFLLLFFLVQHYSAIEGKYQRFLWLLSWWAMDGFIFAWGSSGPVPMLALLLVASTHLLLTWEGLLNSVQGLPITTGWWYKAMLQFHASLFLIEAGVLTCILSSALFFWARTLQA